MVGFLSLLIVVPVFSAVQALFQALLVQLATRIVAGFTPTYRVAYKAVYWGLLIASGTGGLVGLFLGPLMGGAMRSGNPFKSGLGLVLLVGAFLIQAGIYAENIEDYIRGPISFKQACLIIVVSVLILITFIAIGFALVVGVGFLVTRFG